MDFLLCNLNLSTNIYYNAFTVFMITSLRMWDIRDTTLFPYKGVKRSSRQMKGPVQVTYQLASVSEELSHSLSTHRHF